MAAVGCSVEEYESFPAADVGVGMPREGAHQEVLAESVEAHFALLEERIGHFEIVA